MNTISNNKRGFNHLLEASYKIDLSTPISIRPDWNLQNLFHYTRKANIDKIDAGNFIRLRFSKVTDFLDKNEGSSILEPFYHACGSLYDKDIIDKTFFDIARNISYKEITKQRKHVYIICFSKNGCSSFLKERYSAKDGILIPVKKYWIDNFIDEKDFCENTLNLAQVIYSFSKMQKLFERDLKILHTAYLKDIGDKSQSKRLVKTQLRNILIDLISTYIYCYKSSDYKQEEEVRLILKKQYATSNVYNSENIMLEFATSGEVYLKIKGEFADIVEVDLDNEFNSTKNNKAIIENCKFKLFIS